MAGFKTQRRVSAMILYALTGVWLVLWLLGWFVLDNPDLTEPSFYVFWIFVAASLMFMGLRGAIEEY